MKVNAKDLIEQMNDLVRFLDTYFDDFGVKRSEFDRLNVTTVEIIDDILNGDESNQLWSTYGDRVNDLKDKMVRLKALADDIQILTGELSYQIYQDSERLKI